MEYLDHTHTHTSSQVNEKVISAFVGADIAVLKFRLHFNACNHRSALYTAPELYPAEICLAVCVPV